MNTFVNGAFQVPDSRTENGALTFSTSLDTCVDLFFRMGASRGRTDEVAALFAKAYVESPEIAVRLALWARDVRGGAGERAIFRAMFIQLPDVVQIALLDKVVEVGRWDDLLVAFDAGSYDVQAAIAEKWYDAVVNKNDGLAAKWCPRKGIVAATMRGFWEMSPKAFRKTLVNATNVVETPMCAKDWDSINFSHVPSVAASRYNKAFYKNAPDAYKAYKDALVKGEAKINASAIFPHDVVRPALYGGGNTDSDVINAQWKALPDFLEGKANDILVMSDVSGSMTVPVSGQIRAIDISIALGLYISERQTGAFRDLVLTFSEHPTFHKVRGAGIVDRVNNLNRANWGMSTNIEAAFKTILDVAVKNEVPAADMPKMLIILSDMAFDRCARGTNFQNAQRLYAQAGYEMPKVTFWNLNGRPNDVPVRFDQSGTALVSGFSPAIMKSLLAAKQFTPESIMKETILNPRYDVPGITC